MAYRLLWADDEIELLHGHIIFLKSKGYEVVTVTNGRDAIEACRNEDFDLMLLDENMPGLSGLETLVLVKEIRPALPIVMVTKSEEEDIMENRSPGSLLYSESKPSQMAQHRSQLPLSVTMGLFIMMLCPTRNS